MCYLLISFLAVLTKLLTRGKAHDTTSLDESIVRLALQENMKYGLFIVGSKRGSPLGHLSRVGRGRKEGRKEKKDTNTGRVRATSTTSVGYV